MEFAADPVLAEMVRRIVERCEPQKILLFGSRARGDCRADSDYDLLVVLDECEDRRRAAVAMRNVLADVPASKDVIVAEVADIERSARPSEIVRAALSEGLLLYER